MSYDPDPMRGLVIRKMAPRNEQIYWRTIHVIADDIWKRRNQVIVPVPGPFEFEKHEEPQKAAG